MNAARRELPAFRINQTGYAAGLPVQAAARTGSRIRCPA